MNTYRLTGTYRKAKPREEGEIVKLEDFSVIENGETALKAMNTMRMRMYTGGYDNILFTKVELDAGDHWQHVHQC